MSSRVGTGLVTLLIRLGLSWLVGRRHLLLTTTTTTTGATGKSDADTTRRTALPYRWHGGEVRIRVEPGAAWAHDLELHPVAMIQAAPGPLAVAAVFEEDGTISLPPTGRPSPAPVVPDLLWVYPAAVAVLALIRVGRRRRPAR